jgi:hypothetical protein
VSAEYFRFTARGASEPRRSTLLERLVARADRSSQVNDWRADAYRIIAPEDGRMRPVHMPPVAAVALCADHGPVGEAWVCVATPVHYVAEMSNVRLAEHGMLSLSLRDAEALAADFNCVWHNAGIRLTAGRSAGLYCLFDRALDVATHDPQNVVGRHIDGYLPEGRDAQALRRLMSEVEMWLFEHEVNARRAMQGLPVVNGFWLWGGGAPLAALPKVRGSSAGRDVFFDAFKTGESGGDEASGKVIVVPEIPGSDEWAQAESQWLEPALAHLKSGRISRLELSGGNVCFSVSARGAWRFWRRPTPWWESFG